MAQNKNHYSMKKQFYTIPEVEVIETFMTTQILAGSGEDLTKDPLVFEWE